MDRVRQCATAGVEAEGPLMPGAGYDILDDVARREISAGVGATVFRDDEPFGVGQSEHRELKLSNDHEPTTTNGAVVNRDKWSPGWSAHDGL